MSMETSILKSVRAYCNVASDDDNFDRELIPRINNALQNLAKIGVCQLGTTISDDTTEWTDIMLEVLTSLAESYVGNKVLLEFDPPTASSAVTAITESIKETEWTMNQITEGFLT